MATHQVTGSLTLIDKGSAYSEGRGTLSINGKVAEKVNYVGQTVTGAFTLTGSTQVNGLINMTGSPGSGFNVQSDTAANIIAAYPGMTTGSVFQFRLRNAGTGQTATLTTNTGITLHSSNTNTVASGSTRCFYCVVTSSSAITIYSLDSTAH